ncbi:peptidase S8/S53 domain-containing protein [Lactarius quietus]|nr:peptidase S8/S53 domain-containing protein [Lactarius quietus]
MNHRSSGMERGPTLAIKITASHYPHAALTSDPRSFAFALHHSDRQSYLLCHGPRLGFQCPVLKRRPQISSLLKGPHKLVLSSHSSLLTMRCPHLLSALFVLAAAKPLSDPAPRWDDKSVKHAWNVVPMGWESPVTSTAGVTIDLSIALKPHDENALVDALYEVSTPQHRKYGAYLSQDQVADLVAPHPHTLRLVNAWLEHHGVPSSSISTSHGGNWLTLTSVPVSKANNLLSASYQYFLHAETNETIIRTLSYALPEVLHPHVQTIVPTTFFGSASINAPLQPPHEHHSDVAGLEANVESGEHVKLLSSRDTRVTPSLLHSLYNTAMYVPSGARNNIIATVGFNGLSASQADLSAFMAEYRADATGASYIVVQMSGNQYDWKNPSAEMNLDVQYLAAMSYPISQIFYSLANAGDPFISWFSFIYKKPYIPHTISMTYFVVEQTVPPDYANAVCNLFLQLAARGVTVLCPSGNSGVGKGDCRVHDIFGNSQVKFRPTFPASCPFVTAVGGTMGFTRETETAAPLSGGGFSAIFEHPPYQVDGGYVQGYLQNLGGQYEGLYNPEGRGLPDVSAQALNYVSITKGRPIYMRGTNCATPTVAGIISLLNDYQLSKGRKALGFLNPWLYGTGSTGLRDIATGSNPGCGTDGFLAAIGWDPVTGLGTLDFQKLLDVLPVPESPD